MLNFILKEKNIKNLLKKLIENFPRNFIQIIKSEKYAQYSLIARINDAVPLLNDKCYTFLTKIYWIINDIHDFPKCENDGKPLIGKNVKNLKSGYGKNPACCKDCAFKIRYVHCKENNIKKYGYANPFQFRKDDIKQTNIEKYGCTCPANNKDIRSKISENNRIKYGVEHY